MPSSDPTEDAMIVTQVTGGDIDSYGQLIERYEQKLQRYVTYLIHDQTTAQDVVQDTFIKAYQNLKHFNPNYKFSSWIYRIAHNEAMNAVKKLKHLSYASIDESPDTNYLKHIEKLVDQNILKKDVQGCLQKLEPKYREVVQLVYLERMKYDEVSDILHVPASTVGVWLSRAKTKLKDICAKKGVTR